MSFEALAITWFVLEGVLLTGYALLDGFDLGVGILHPFVPRTDLERRISMNSIGPLWDGNEVWLVTFGGALFAAFPEAYASVFSGFYTAFMLLLGVAVGNAMIGVPLDEAGNFTGSVLDQLGPYPLLVGVMTVSLFAMHGGLFLYLKTEGDFQQRLRDWMWRSWGFFMVTFMLTTIATVAFIPRATENFRRFPWAIVVVVGTILAVANVPRCLYRDKPGLAFLSSGGVIAGLVALFGLALYPNLVTATGDPSRSVTIFNAASSPKTLGIMLIIAAVGMPFVLTYSGVIYWTFRGKVKLGEQSY